MGFMEEEHIKLELTKPLTVQSQTVPRAWPPLRRGRPWSGSIYTACSRRERLLAIFLMTCQLIRKTGNVKVEPERFLQAQGPSGAIFHIPLNMCMDPGVESNLKNFKKPVQGLTLALMYGEMHQAARGATHAGRKLNLSPGSRTLGKCRGRLAIWR